MHTAEVAGTTNTTEPWPAFSAAHSAAFDAFHDAWEHNDREGMARAELRLLRNVDSEWQREIEKAGRRS